LTGTREERRGIREKEKVKRGEESSGAMRFHIRQKRPWEQEARKLEKVIRL